jgi:hypothetical protein
MKLLLPDRTTTERVPYEALCGIRVEAFTLNKNDIEQLLSKPEHLVPYLNEMLKRFYND